MSKFKVFSAVGLLGLISITSVEAMQVKVTITNNAAMGGVAITPVWVGFHNGSFDSYNPGDAASSQLQLLAEDGNSSALASAFAMGSGNRVQGSIGSAPITAEVRYPPFLIYQRVWIINISLMPVWCCQVAIISLRMIML